MSGYTVTRVTPFSYNFSLLFLYKDFPENGVTAVTDVTV